MKSKANQPDEPIIIEDLNINESFLSILVEGALSNDDKNNVILVKKDRGSFAKQVGELINRLEKRPTQNKQPNNQEKSSQKAIEEFYNKAKQQNPEDFKALYNKAKQQNIILTNDEALVLLDPLLEFANHRYSNSDIIVFDNNACEKTNIINLVAFEQEIAKNEISPFVLKEILDPIIKIIVPLDIASKYNHSIDKAIEGILNKNVQKTNNPRDVVAKTDIVNLVDLFYQKMKLYNQKYKFFNNDNALLIKELAQKIVKKIKKEIELIDSISFDPTGAIKELKAEIEILETLIFKQKKNLFPEQKNLYEASIKTKDNELENTIEALEKSTEKIKAEIELLKQKKLDNESLTEMQQFTTKIAEYEFIRQQNITSRKKRLEKIEIEAKIKKQEQQEQIEIGQQDNNLSANTEDTIENKEGQIGLIDIRITKQKVSASSAKEILYKNFINDAFVINKEREKFLEYSKYIKNKSSLSQKKTNLKNQFKNIKVEAKIFGKIIKSKNDELFALCFISQSSNKRVCAIEDALTILAGPHTELTINDGESSAFIEKMLVESREDGADPQEQCSDNILGDSGELIEDLKPKKIEQGTKQQKNKSFADKILKNKNADNIIKKAFKMLSRSKTAKKSSSSFSFLSRVKKSEFLGVGEYKNQLPEQDKNGKINVSVKEMNLFIKVIKKLITANPNTKERDEYSQWRSSGDVAKILSQDPKFSLKQHKSNHLGRHSVFNGKNIVADKVTPAINQIPQKDAIEMMMNKFDLISAKMQEASPNKNTKSNITINNLASNYKFNEISSRAM
jgi:hypothetical protein